MCTDVGKRIDDIEKSIGEIMNDLGDEEEQAGGSNAGRKDKG